MMAREREPTKNSLNTNDPVRLHMHTTTSHGPSDGEQGILTSTESTEATTTPV